MDLADSGSGIAQRTQVLIAAMLLVLVICVGIVVLHLAGWALGKFTDKLTELAYPGAGSPYYSSSLSLFGWLWLGQIAICAVCAFLFLSCPLGVLAVASGGLFALVTSTKDDPKDWESG